MNNKVIKEIVLTDIDNTAIPGVFFKQLKSNGDERGFFREIVRFNDPFFIDGKFGQWSHSRMCQNVVKAWHFHHIQTDWWYIGIGTVETVLFDNREDSPTYKTKLVFNMGDEGLNVAVKIPPKVLHGCKVLSASADLFYITSETYNPKDEGRYPYNSDLVGHNWGQSPIVADNDKRLYLPEI